MRDITRYIMTTQLHRRHLVRVHVVRIPNDPLSVFPSHLQFCRNPCCDSENTTAHAYAQWADPRCRRTRHSTMPPCGVVYDATPKYPTRLTRKIHALTGSGGTYIVCCARIRKGQLLHVHLRALEVKDSVLGLSYRRRGEACKCGGSCIQYVFVERLEQRREQ